jgi:23S rRNA pseudouridine1911/1915/1917 synthase
MEIRKIEIPQGVAEQRLDLYLSRLQELSLSRSQIQRLIKEGSVTVNGKMVKSNHKIRPGEEVTVQIPILQPLEVLPEDIHLDVYYEDESVIVVNKPPNMVVHPAAGNWSGTLVNALLFYCKDLSGIGGKIRPGVVHRLDKDTSGLLVFAKDDNAHKVLSKQIKDRIMKRRYLAIVTGDLKGSGRIEAPIGRAMADRKRMSVKTKKGREAVTNYRVLERLGQATLVEVGLETGRTHQIRVHFSYIRHPILGDPVYGGKSSGLFRQNIGLKSKLKRQMLHAETLGFSHPRTGEYLEFSCPIPQDMKDILKTLQMQNVSRKHFQIRD